MLRPYAYSTCKFCQEMVQQDLEGSSWTATATRGDGSECRKAPNPDEGPMPSHESNGVVVKRRS